MTTHNITNIFILEELELKTDFNSVYIPSLFFLNILSWFPAWDGSTHLRDIFAPFKKWVLEMTLLKFLSDYSELPHGSNIFIFSSVMRLIWGLSVLQECKGVYILRD